MQTCAHIQVFLRGGIVFVAIPFNRALVARGGGHSFYQLAYTHVYACTHIHIRELTWGWSQVLLSKHAGFAEIVHMQEFAQR